MNKQLIFTALIIFNFSATKAMLDRSKDIQVTTPEGETLKKVLCNSGYRLLVDKTDIVQNLARKRLSAPEFFATVVLENSRLISKTTIPAIELQKHPPYIAAAILQNSPEAIKALYEQNLLSLEALEELRCRGTVSPELFHSIIQNSEHLA